MRPNKAYKQNAGGAARTVHYASQSNHSKAPVVVGVIVGLLLVVYFAGVFFFSHNFLPSTTVNGEDVSMKSDEQLAAEVRALGAEYTTHVTGDGVDLHMTSQDIELSYDGEKFADAALSQQAKWLWPYELTQSRSIELAKPVTYSAEKLTGLVNKAVKKANKKADPPTNANVVFSKNAKSYEITKEKVGTAVDKGAAYTAVSEAVADLNAEIELGAGQLEQPTVLSDDARLATARDVANSYVKNSIDLTVDDVRVLEVTPELISSWVKIDANFDASLDSSAIGNWAKGDLSKKFDTMGATRKYKRADGKQVTVTGGNYGWVLNGEQTAKQLHDKIENADADPLEIPMKTRGEKWAPGGADWTRYIDVDIAQQHVRMYDEKGKVIWEADCVTGSVKDGHDTPTGVYTISKKATNKTLIGADEDKDGKPDYESKVTYWMPFVGEWVGLHDASWRKKFGGDIYKTDGSHGCVNLPAKKAKELFDLVKNGDVVCCHG